MDLPDYLPGIPPMYGIKQPSPEFSQGNDVVIMFELLHKSKPITDPRSWILEVFIKKSLKAQNILWRGTLGEGLRQDQPNSSNYYFRIPCTISSLFLPGTYYFAVRGQQKPAQGSTFDDTVTLYKGMFTLSLDAASPNPKLSGGLTTVVQFDPTDLSFKSVSTSTEPTEPETSTPHWW